MRALIKTVCDQVKTKHSKKEGTDLTDNDMKSKSNVIRHYLPVRTCIIIYMLPQETVSVRVHLLFEKK